MSDKIDYSAKRNAALANVDKLDDVILRCLATIEEVTRALNALSEDAAFRKQIDTSYLDVLSAEIADIASYLPAVREELIELDTSAFAAVSITNKVHLWTSSVSDTFKTVGTLLSQLVDRTEMAVAA